MGGRGGEGRAGEGANKVLQPAQSVRLRASMILCKHIYVDMYNQYWSYCTLLLQECISTIDPIGHN